MTLAEPELNLVESFQQMRGPNTDPKEYRALVKGDTRRKDRPPFFLETAIISGPCRNPSGVDVQLLVG